MRLFQRLCSPLAAMAGFPPRPNTATPAPFQRPARPPPPPASPGDFGDFGGFGGVRGGGVPPVALTPPSEEAIQTIMVSFENGSPLKKCPNSAYFTIEPWF